MVGTEPRPDWPGLARIWGPCAKVRKFPIIPDVASRDPLRRKGSALIPLKGLR